MTGARTRDVLLHAANLLEQEGWCQRRFINNMGERCASMAIYEGLSDTGVLLTYNQTINWFLAWLNKGKSVADSYGSVPQWNDEPERTKEEVIAALRTCAEELA